MNNTIDAYDNERGHYNFSFSDSDGKHISVSFRAEPDYDLDIIFQEFQNFLVASGHDVEGPIGELNFDEGSYDDGDIYSDEVHAMTQAQAADKFSMENFPNNGWPFGGLTTASIPALTTADIAPLTVTDLSTNQTYSYSDWTKVNQFPTMSPLTSEQITSWSLPTQDIKSWQVNMPGTLGGAKVQYK
jgi:hypothetical protein